MAKLGISTGAAPDDGTGSSLLVGAARVNSNFNELYTLLGAGSTTTLAPGIVTSIVAGDNISVSGGTGQVTITGAANTSHVNAVSLSVSGISTLGITTFQDDLFVISNKDILLGGQNTIKFENGAGDNDVIKWGSAANNLKMGYAMSGYASGQAAIESDYSLYLKGLGGRVNVRATGTGSADKVYLDSNNGVSIETNATVIGILTASNVSTAGSVTAATFYGNGAGLTGVGGGGASLWASDTIGINTTSNVGLGTTAKDGYPLYVQGDALFAGDTAGKDVTFDSSNNWLKFNDETKICLGTAALTTLFHNSVDLYIQNGVGDIRLEPKSGEPGLWLHRDGAVELYDGTAAGTANKKFETTEQGTLTTGISSATSFSGHGNDLVTSQWAVANSGSSHYTFTGPGNLSAAEDPTLYLARGQTYEFVLNASGHPFRIQTTSGAYDAGTQYTTGVTNSGAAVGTIKFQIPFNAPNTLYYVCQNHSAMAGTLTIYPSI